MAITYDSIIIGAGINGLVTAAYLGKAGQRVLVLERRGVAGGLAAAEEIAPGYRVDAAAHDVGWIPPKVMRELQLAQHGLELVHPDPAVCALLPDGGYLPLWNDPVRAAEAIRPLSAADASRWAPFSERMTRLRSFLEHVYSAPPPAVTSTAFADLIALVTLGRRMRGLGRVEMMELLRTLPMSVAELLDDWFESDPLKGAVGAGGITGILQGPRSAGTAFVLLHRHVGAHGLRSRAVARGGMGSLARAVAAAARTAGAEIRTGVEVAEILVRDGSATGVAMAGGDHIAGRHVVSSVDPRRTLLGLTDPMHLDPEFVRAVQNIKMRGATAKVNLALGELPRFGAGATAGGASGDAHLRGAITVAPSLDYLERAYDDAKHGGVSHRPYLEARIPSLHDPALAPVGKHVMSVLVQFAPYRRTDGEWDAARREAVGDLVVATLAEYAPNLKSAIVARQVLTPRDLETEYGLTEGNMQQGELTLDQILFMRPVPGWSRYRMPIRELYLCGAGTHPGGIAGASGWLAAAEILKGTKQRAESRTA